MSDCKLQLGCLCVVGYLALVYCRERRHASQRGLTLYDLLLLMGIHSLVWDTVTAVTVNYLDTVPPLFNLAAHGLFLLSLDGFVFLLLLYILSMGDSLPVTPRRRALLFVPFAVVVALVLLSLGGLEYRHGVITNYSMGVAVYFCFGTVAVSILLSLTAFARRWRYLESHKRVGVFTSLCVLALVTGLQMLMPELLITSLGVTMILLGTYMNHEDPALRHLAESRNEMVQGFATLVENRDGSTGGHIRRTTLYVELLVKALRDRGYYREIFTKDYLRSLCQAAPMHDIGKIAVPDAILQKPGRLTEEEFAAMKRHTVDGERIIRQTFSNMDDPQYTRLCCQIARSHHEKWNGRGYPDGLAGEDIPLCARIMSIADVFDAVSEDRCYRPAMPLDQCFAIIEQGKGTDFDPLLAQVFLDIRPEVEKTYYGAARQLALHPQPNS